MKRTQQQGGDGATAGAGMGRSRLRRALLLGYARVCDATAAPRSCRTDAADVDRGLAAIHAMVTHRIGPALEELHAVTARRGMGGGYG